MLYLKFAIAVIAITGMILPAIAIGVIGFVMVWALKALDNVEARWKQRAKNVVYVVGYRTTYRELYWTGDYEDGGPTVTDKLHKACRFSYKGQAEAMLDLMPNPDAWDVREHVWVP